MALKLIFKYQRDRYTQGTEIEIDNKVKQNLNNILNGKGITITHMYKPARHSVKVIFPTEADIDKVMEHEEEIKTEQFEPRMSLSLKACRTIFCTNFDQSLLETYTKENIMDFLKQQKWKVKDIYIMNSKKSFKIEMTSRKQAQDFLNKETIDIGGIRISNNSKEPEIDPTIRQCWECGAINPDHNSDGCTGRKICIKCGETGHKFYGCTLPKDEEEMNETQKGKRFCAACGSRGTHTTLDHRQCPKKREILRERARIEREKRVTINESKNRDEELIRKVININNNEEFPPLINRNQFNKQQTGITTILTLALIDEANNPGTFERKFEEGLKNNGLPSVKYTLEPDTAKNFQKVLCGAQIMSTQTSEKMTATSSVSKYFKDNQRQKRNADEEDNWLQDKNEEESQSDPKKIKIIPANNGEKEKGATALPMEQDQPTRTQILTEALKERAMLKEQMHKQLLEELGKKWIIIGAENNKDKQITNTMENIAELLNHPKICNNKEWLLMVKGLVVKLMDLGQRHMEMTVKVREINDMEQDF